MVEYFCPWRYLLQKFSKFRKSSFNRSLYDVRFRSGSFFENLGDKLIVDDIDLEVTLELN